MAREIERYGAYWNSSLDPLEIELACLKKGGKWLNKDGQPCGLGLFEHYMNARKLAWPERYRHRWTDLIYHEIISNIVTVFMGAGSTGKTSHASEYALLSYWARPHSTLVLVSTTTVDKLNSAILGEIKMLLRAAQERFPWLAGHVIDSKHAIVTDDIEVTSVRDIRKGIIGKACYVGQSWVGLGVLSGIKQSRIIFIADELQFMQASFMDCLPNMFTSVDVDANHEPDIKVIGSGNPKHDPYDQLSIAAEPVDGWPSVEGIDKTTAWNTKFHRGRCVNLVGTDSPNFDVPEGKRPPYPRLINRGSVKLIETRWGKDSLQYWSQCKGVMRLNMMGKRVLTIALCRQHHAFDPVVWLDDLQTRVGFLDPAWGGETADRCVWGWLEFGMDINNREVIAFGEYATVPIIVTNPMSPDDQIAQFVHREAKRNGIPGVNIFYGSTGRGTTGSALAKVFGHDAPIAIAEGDKPTERAVRADLLISDENGVKRHKKASEEYARMNAELWFAVRNIVESEQMRNLPEEVAREFTMREYMPTPGGKVALEKKEDTRERMGTSPDLADAFSFGVEGARQRGFIVGHAGFKVIEANKDNEDWFETEAKEYENAMQAGLLDHSGL